MRGLSLFALLLTVVLSGCSTPGAFFGATQGESFRPHQLSDDKHALVYLYRPQSDWADQELEAPALFLNNQLIGSLPSNGYLVLEFDVASYQLEMRRPLFGSGLYGLTLPTAPVLTGPGFVDASNIDATLGGVQKGAR